MTAPGATSPMQTLKGCPFCGGQNIDAKGWSTSTDVHGPACDDCGASAGMVSQTHAENIEAWNRRASPEPATVGKDYGKLEVMEATPNDGHKTIYLRGQDGTWICSMSEAGIPGGDPGDKVEGYSQALANAHELARRWNEGALVPAAGVAECSACQGTGVVATTTTDHNGDHVEMPCPVCAAPSPPSSGWKKIPEDRDDRAALFGDDRWLFGCWESKWTSEGYYDAEQRGFWNANTHHTDAHDGQMYPTHYQRLPSPPTTAEDKP